MSEKASFFTELRRRNVYKAAVAYAIAAWALGQGHRAGFSGPRHSELCRAISTLVQLLQTRYNSRLYRPVLATPVLLRLDPIWHPLRGDPAFQKLCEEKQP